MVVHSTPIMNELIEDIHERGNDIDIETLTSHKQHITIITITIAITINHPQAHDKHKQK